MDTDQSDDLGTQDRGVGRDHIVVEGETPVTLPATRETAATSFDLTTRTIRFQCASGDWLEDDWTGIPVDRLLAQATLPPETTHVVVAAADGYKSCVTVAALADAMVAYDATDRPSTDFPRFVSTSVGGPRAVKNLASITPVELAGHEDPQDYEDLQLDDG